MRNVPLGPSGLILFAALAVLVIPVQNSAMSGQLDSLDNGFEMILVENHGSPMIASVIFVESGSRYESKYENGITHLLEHLLFDGTTNLTRDELSGTIRDLGGYINAFTRKDLTAYMVLMPAQYIETGLTVQADMLFNSIFPEDELVKGRAVVIEEIRQSSDAPGAPAESFFTEKAYGATDYGRPVLGHETLIANIPRAAIIDYWKSNYTPDKMTALVIGDFETNAMRDMIERVFGSIPRGKGESTEPIDIHRQLAETKGRTNSLSGARRYDTVADLSSTCVNFSLAGPSFDSDEYLAFDLLAQYLNLDEISPLKTAPASGPNPFATEVTVSLDTRPEFTRMEISVLTDRSEAADSIVSSVLATLASMSTCATDSIDLQGIKISNRCEAIYSAERLHYYGVIVGPMLVIAGWEWLQAYPDRFDEISWDQCQKVAESWLTEPDYVVTVVRPADSGATPYMDRGPAERDVVAYFDTTEFAEYDLSTGVSLTFPSIDSVSMELVDRAAYHREVLGNGLTVLIKSNPDNRVFALNLIARNRSANEPEGLGGITDFVNRCLEKGTLTRDAATLTRDLASIGARLTQVDNPWIPFDDRYTTRSFAFVKFETIEDFAAEGFDLFTDLVNNPAFDSVEVENVRNQMLGIIGRAAGSTSKTARDLFFEMMFPEHPFARPIMGTARSIGSIDIEALRSHHTCFYSPQNLILSVVTSRDTTEIMDWIRTGWAGLTNACQPAPSPESPAAVFASEARHLPMDKEQVAIRVGGRLPGIDADESLDLRVAASILSSRLFRILREKQGLAYSTGAVTGFDQNFGWYYLTIGTGSENYARARDGLALQTDKLAFDGPTAAEVARAKNQTWGRLMSAKLARVNQAYYLGINEFYGRPVDYDALLLGRLRWITPATVREAAARYFQPEVWIEGSAGSQP